MQAASFGRALVIVGPITPIKGESVFRPYCMRRKHGALALLAATLAFGLAACGGDDDDDGQPASRGDQPQAAEKAFLTGMVAHHRSAIEMARIAEERGRDRFVTQLAEDIISSQDLEIVRMEEIHERLFDGELKPDAAAHDRLGLSAEEAGMTHSAETSRKLRSADPFDRAFVDEMVPHHEGAVRMARAVLKSATDSDLRELAQGIISAQEREVEEMNEFRTRKFGGPVPKGAGRGGESGEMMPETTEEHGAGHSE